MTRRGLELLLARIERLARDALDGRAARVGVLDEIARAAGAVRDKETRARVRLLERRRVLLIARRERLRAILAAARATPIQTQRAERTWAVLYVVDCELVRLEVDTIRARCEDDPDYRRRFREGRATERRWTTRPERDGRQAYRRGNNFYINTTGTALPTSGYQGLPVAICAAPGCFATASKRRRLESRGDVVFLCARCAAAMDASRPS